MAYKATMVTTVDNPFDPFEQFDQWFLFDVEKGYNTCAKLGRLGRISDEMSQKEENDEVERVIDRIIELDFMNIYIKVKRKASKLQDMVDDTTED